MEQVILIAEGAIFTIILAIATGIVKYLATQVKELTRTVESLTVEYAQINTGCAERHTAINARLRVHDTKIDELKEKVGGHETRITINENEIENLKEVNYDVG